MIWYAVVASSALLSGFLIGMVLSNRRHNRSIKFFDDVLVSCRQLLISGEHDALDKLLHEMTEDIPYTPMAKAAYKVAKRRSEKQENIDGE